MQEVDSVYMASFTKPQIPIQLDHGYCPDPIEGTEETAPAGSFRGRYTAAVSVNCANFSR